MAGALCAGAGLATERETPSLSELDLSVDVDRLEPQVTIKEFDNRQVKEYEVNGNVYMIEVTPKHGRPYYITDPDGDGVMEWRRSSVGMDVQPPRWALFRW